jgi:hypothetical protein
LDPSCSLNGGLRYDEGLLFGYRRDQIRKLLGHYKAMRRVLGTAESESNDAMS